MYSESYINEGTPLVPTEENSIIASISSISGLDNGKWIGSFRTHDGTIYLKGHFKTSNGGKTVVSQRDVDVEELTRDPGQASISLNGLFYATGGYAKLIKPGVYSISAWRSSDELKTLNNEVAFVYVPQGPKRDRKNNEWYGLYVHRSIIEMPDGSWLMTMYGNFDEDTSSPQDGDAKKETSFMMRTFIVASTDRGHSWHYLSSVAVPKSGDPIGEGFGEPAITLLDDGRLLVIMRTGHHFPLYASWSADAGKTWTPPLYTGLDRACDPHLINLRDGRLALSWGRRYPEGWSKITPEGDQIQFKYPGEGYTNLAISSDSGATWINRKVAQKTGSGYSTIFEVEPNVIFFQVDQWVWRVTLKPKTNLTR
ncbi:MAG: glycoside hydrolase [Nitrososphaera sp.]|nr:glycoside hydrolase [Nitrososphaera sp.]